MAINHRISGLIFAFATGLLASYCSYQWITNPDRGAQRALEESVVLESREFLKTYVAPSSELEISDPLDRIREAGKVYIYPLSAGWEISGQYRRPGERRWHPYLMTLDSNQQLVRLTVNDDDAELQARASGDSRFTVTPRN